VAAGLAIYDFTNPEACQWYADKLKGLVAMGVDCFKTDFGERIPTDVQWFDGSDPQKMHNHYAFIYNELVWNVLKETVGEKEAVLFARSASVGAQQFPVHWGGDCYANYESMAESLRGGLSIGMSGFGFWSHDIGGFENTAPAHVYKRWCAFGLLSSHSRLHGSKSYRVPWAYDDESCDVVRHFTQLKCRMMPYLYRQAALANEFGTPMLRAMMLEFPDDPACDYLDRQYMLGDSVLVAPVFSEAGDVQFYLPEGRWTHLWHNDELPGSRWHKQNHDALSLPVYVRDNTCWRWATMTRNPITPGMKAPPSSCSTSKMARGALSGSGGGRFHDLHPEGEAPGQHHRRERRRRSPRLDAVPAQYPADSRRAGRHADRQRMGCGGERPGQYADDYVVKDCVNGRDPLRLAERVFYSIFVQKVIHFSLVTQAADAVAER
jgi:hypothetical protein